jgi:hypothetical protein
MRVMTLLLLIALPAHATDTRSCRYWLSRLSEVARLEATLLHDIKKVHERDGIWAAQEFRYEVQQQLARLREAINRDNDR